MGIVKAVNISRKKGEIKENIHTCKVNMQGLENDAHSGDWHRQISLLAEESIDKIRHLSNSITYGSFAENITSQGIRLHELPIGSFFKINDVVLELTQIGKKCHNDCAIMQQVGKCVMPTEGVFAKVIHPGTISEGDEIRVILPNE
ncbi:MAG: MOSC domain-containing protein [Promethearchaeia archaeon]|nr:MAG: MOSC domain-containing protein [Candidatus Lokiarchaeia archaeon]